MIVGQGLGKVPTSFTHVQSLLRAYVIGKSIGEYRPSHSLHNPYAVRSHEVTVQGCLSRSSGAIALIYVGALVLARAVLSLGIGLLRAPQIT
jgi:hypothetical protein